MRIEALETGLPGLIRHAGTAASPRFLEFFTAVFRNPNTREAYAREAYARAAVRFCDWCEVRRIQRPQIQPIIIAAYIEELDSSISRPSVKLHLAALRMLFDHLALGQILSMTPASSVHGPKHFVKSDKTY